jgi:hypothetical protein
MQVALVDDLEEDVGGVGAVGEIAHLVDLCGAPHNSTYGEPSVMWSAAALPQEAPAFSYA